MPPVLIGNCLSFTVIIIVCFSTRRHHKSALLVLAAGGDYNRVDFIDRTQSLWKDHS